MSTEAAQLGFAAEFALFLVLGATASVVLAGRSQRRAMLLRAAPGRLASRWVLLGGILLIAVAAFLAGSQLIDGADEMAVAVPRFVGVLVLVAAAAAVPDPAGRLLLGGGAALVGAAQVAHVTGAHNGAHVAQLLGTLLLGAATVRLSQRSIPARITTASAATVLLVVLAVAVATSAVLTNNVSDEALNRTAARAAAEASEAETAAANAIVSARIVASSLPGQRFAELSRVADAPDSADGQAAADSIREDLARLSDFLFARGPLLYVIPSGRAVAVVGEVDDLTVVDLVGSRLVTESISAQAATRSVVEAAGTLYAGGAHPVVVPGPEGARNVGVIIATDRLDGGYLEARRVDLPDEGLAFVTRAGVLAADGPLPGGDGVLEIGSEALDVGEPVRSEQADHFAVAHPVLSPDGAPVGALVAALPTAAVDETRESLLQALFMAALLAVLLAVVLANLVGRRIGAGVRRLTDAAERMEQGELDTRAEVTSADEVGVLATTFNSMAASIGAMTGDLREAAAEEARLRGRMEAVVAGMGEGLIAIDADGAITDINAAAEGVIGVEAPAAIGAKAADLFRLIDRDGRDVSGRLVGDGADDERWSVDGTLAGAAGNVPVLVSAGAVMGADGERVGTTLVIRDVRSEREIEQMKTDFLSNISHELRTPLTPIKGYAGLMAGRQLEPGRVRDLGVAMLQSSRQLERVIDQLVGFATIAAGRLTLRTETLDLREQLDEAIVRWKDRLPAGYHLGRRVAKGTPKVTADARYLAQSLDELIDNAVKFTPGGGRVWLRARPSEHRKGAVDLQVVDKGVGIENADLGDLVGDFSQGDPSATRRFGGLGLGLAMVDRIVRAHRGRLILESEPGKGSTFTIVLPKGKAGARQTRRAGSRARGRPKSGAKRSTKQQTRVRKQQ